MKTVKYYSTIGLYASIPGFKKQKLVRISCDKLEDGTRKVYVESGHNLAKFKTLGEKIISQEQAENLFSDCQGQEFRNFASLFGIEA